MTWSCATRADVFATQVAQEKVASAGVTPFVTPFVTSYYEFHVKVNEIGFFSFTYLVSCTFEESYPPLCNYKKGSGRFKWLLGSGGTPSTSTGPSNDHTLRDSRGKEDIAKCYRWLHVQVTDLKNRTGSSKLLFVMSRF